MDTAAQSPADDNGAGTPRRVETNEALVLTAVRRGARSRVALVSETGLIPQTVSNVTRRLIDAGLLHEVGKERIPGHRKPRTLLDLDPTGCYAAGVHFDPVVATCVILDFAGGVVVESRQSLTPGTDAQATTAMIAAQVGDLIERSGVNPARIAGVGVAAPGPIDGATGTLLSPPHLPGWDRVPLRDMLSRRLGRRVLLEKDVIACAVGEQWVTGTDAPANFAFLYLGTGAGIGLVVDSSVVRGRSGNAGDVGLLAVTADEIGERFTGDFHAFWEVASQSALVHQGVEAGVLPREAGGNTSPEANELFALLCRAADGGDEVAVGILDRAARYTASAALTIGNLLDVDTIVMGGAMWDQVASRFLPIMTPIVDRVSVTRQLHKVTLRGTTLGRDVAAMGAACLVLEDLFSPA
ncbi:ROK family protein [Microbacterium nymphoidis]|uniref:ROK family protein n=1 Tax=Microbacterium nymphoidis TaxID=2898586 RepID=UPI001E304170|nr:ROK family protein [Microbacterium nymphoidis]MCD2498848.1 ROK family protein [Microbacterium nymphoidis]